MAACAAFALLIVTSSAAASVHSPVRVGDALWGVQEPIEFGDGVETALVRIDRHGARTTYLLPMMSVGGDLQRIQPLAIVAHGSDALWMAARTTSDVNYDWSSSALYLIDTAALGALPSGAVVPTSMIRTVAQAPRGDMRTYDFRALAEAGDRRLVAIRGAWGPCEQAMGALVTMSSDGGDYQSRVWPAQDRPTHFFNQIRVDSAGRVWLSVFATSYAVCDDGGLFTMWGGNSGLGVFDDGTVLSSMHRPDAAPAFAGCLAPNFVAGFTTADDGAMWCGMGNAVARFSSLTDAVVFRLPDEFAHEFERPLAAGPDGSVWFTWQRRTDPQANGPHEVARLTRDGALYRYPASWGAAISSTGPQCDSCYQLFMPIIPGPGGGIWLGRSSRGDNRYWQLRFASAAEISTQGELTETLPPRGVTDWWRDPPAPLPRDAPPPAAGGAANDQGAGRHSTAPAGRSSTPRAPAITIRLGSVLPKATVAFRRATAIRIPVRVAPAAEVTVSVTFTAAALRRLRVRAPLGLTAHRSVRRVRVKTIVVPLPTAVRRAIARSPKPVSATVELVARHGDQAAELRQTVRFAVKRARRRGGRRR